MRKLGLDLRLGSVQGIVGGNESWILISNPQMFVARCPCIRLRGLSMNRTRSSNRETEHPRLCYHCKLQPEMGESHG